MNKGTEKFLTQELGIDIGQLDQREHDIITLYDDHGLLRHPELWKLNVFISGGFVRLLTSDNPYQLLHDLFNAVNKEAEAVIILTAEWFTPLSHNILLIDNAGNVDVQILSDTWDQYYSEVIALQLFHIGNKDFELINNDFKSILYNLFQVCGLPKRFIEHFFSQEFQDFVALVVDVILGVHQQNIAGVYLAVNKIMKLEVPNTAVTDVESLNAILLDHPEEYGALIDFMITNLGILRQTTVSILESYVFPSSPNPNARLMGDADLQLTAFKDFNELLRSVTETEEIDAKCKKTFSSYLEAVERQGLKTSGFQGVAFRQLKFLADFNPEKEAQEFKNLLPAEKEAKVAARNKDIDDLSILHRMKFILKGRERLTTIEKGLFYQKLADIIKSLSVNFYADIFELYFYFLSKASGVEIELLKSQSAKGQEVSTCDYKFGKSVAADCKCIIADHMKMQNISTWCEKIGKQVQSTIDHEGVKFGGGVIAMKDQNIDFLSALREFKGTDLYDQEERAYVVSLLLEIYSEFRRHTDVEQDKVKFIVLYYIPANPISPDELEGADAYSVKQVSEIMAVITTKYASDEEFEVICDIFKPVSHFIFKFTNRLL